MTTDLAGIFILFAVGTILFQTALILGAPWGHMTQGRIEKGPLPARARIFAAISILILVFMAGAMLSAVGRWPGWPAWTGWLTVGLAGLTTLVNAISPSVAEKRLWAPVSTLMFLMATGVMVL